MSTRSKRERVRLLWRAFSLPPDERLLGAHAIALLLRAAGSLRARGLARTQTRLAGSHAPRHSLSPTRAAQIVDAAALLVPGGTCLARSLVLAHLVGGTARVCIGVRSHVDELDAHAWVELGTDVLNDAPDVRTRFAVIHETGR